MSLRAVVANREWKEAHRCRLGFEGASPLQSTLEADGGFDDILKLDAHYTTKILSGSCRSCVVCSDLSRQERRRAEMNQQVAWSCSVGSFSIGSSAVSSRPKHQLERDELAR